MANEQAEKYDYITSFPPDVEALFSAVVGTEKDGKPIYAIEREETTVDISADASPTNEKLSAKHTRLVFNSLEALLTYNGGRMRTVLDDAGDRVDAKRRAVVRGRLITENQPPESAYIKEAKALWDKHQKGEKIPKFLRSAKSVNEMAALLFNAANEED